LARALSGYGIKKLLDISAAYFRAAQVQIHRPLQNPEDDGLVQLSEMVRVCRPSRKIYEITHSGHEALRVWPPSNKRSDFITHSSLLLQLFFSGTLSRKKQVHSIHEQLDICKNIEAQFKKTLFKKNDFLVTAGCTQDGPNYRASIHTYKWPVFSIRSYSVFLESMKEYILTDTHYRNEINTQGVSFE
jgi:DNA-binding PadR family transcriptional regulator